MTDIRKLINIIQETESLAETPEEVRAQIEKRVEKIPDESDLVDVLKYTNKFAIKKDVEKFTTLRNYKGTVSTIILQTLAEADVGEAEVKKLLKKLSTDGILNEKKLLTPGQVHSYEDLIDPEFKNVFNAIKVSLFERISGKMGEKGDVGKGEYMLDIISPNVNRRGAPGDLDVKGTKIELKAGQNGRLGPAGSMSLAGRFQREFIPVAQKIMPKKPIEAGDATLFNPKLDMSYFSDFFETAKNVKLALTAMMKMHYPDYPVANIVNAVVDGSGGIDGKKLKEEMLKASYSSYKSEKEFDGIVIMDAEVTKFLFIRTPEDIARSSSGLLVSFPSWTDTQGNCMKVTLAKGGRATSEPTTSAPKAKKEITKRVDITPPGSKRASRSEPTKTPRARR